MITRYALVVVAGSETRRRISVCRFATLKAAQEAEDFIDNRCLEEGDVEVMVISDMPKSNPGMIKNLPDVTREELLGAIREGVHDAIWQMITNATSMPCNDFYDCLKAGVVEGIAAAAEKVVHETQS